MVGGDRQTEHAVLFVVGQGRSGTSALTDVLNGHPQIALGMERFKRLWIREMDRLGPELFERDRFFDFSDGLTNITPDAGQRWVDHYAALEAKWDTATYRGDKMTQVAVQRLARQIPGSRFVCIVRDPAEVAASWNVRARDDGDRWPTRHDAVAAIRLGNVDRRRISRARQAMPKRVDVVRYRRFFGDPRGRALAALIERLGLEPHPGVDAAFARAHQHYVETVAPKDRGLSEDETQFVTDHVDWDVWATLRRQAL